ncbi:hypothetical protein NC651_037513 [Populus alba x Populus x berolinensis]|nr:hypothetical protein NC651_037513 [Populus alba x Populus x berolinensis]
MYIVEEVQGIQVLALNFPLSQSKIQIFLSPTFDSSRNYSTGHLQQHSRNTILADTA